MNKPAINILFIGIGNEYCHDDAAGIVAARRLKETAPEGMRIVEQSGEGTSLLALWEKEKSIILCDAVSSGDAAGKIHCFDAKTQKIPTSFFRYSAASETSLQLAERFASEQGSPRSRGYSTHAFSVAEAIELARTLERLPAQMIVYGIEGKNFQTGVGLSPEVEKSVNEVVRRIKNWGQSLFKMNPGFGTVPNFQNRSQPALQLELKIRGAVQGVGFRPFIYRLATELGLTGWVSNSSQGLLIGAEGEKDLLERFLLRIQQEKPPRATIQSLESTFTAAAGYTRFEIRPSREHGKKTAVVLPDIATCNDCLSEIFNPQDRRYQYPFTNCTNCGPRFTIAEAIPYDRSNTTMKHFKMCVDCRAEYDNPLNRRFHAEPNACPWCGPSLELWNGDGKIAASKQDALLQTALALRDGKIIAVKGIGGFHLMVASANERGVLRLRERKHREAKPFALLFPSLKMVKEAAEISSLEEKLLTSPESPIVLLRKKSSQLNLAHAVAPDNPYLGIMLPSTPLHHLLLQKLGFPVVATSGNLSDEPICIDEQEAVQRLRGIADLFLVHNRPIVRHADDSIARVMAGRPMVLRRARGYAPLPIQKQDSLPAILAVGAHQKNTIAVSAGNEVFMSQHIGDLETSQAFDAFQSTIEDFKTFYEVQPVVVACDAHPDYLSTQYAGKLGTVPNMEMTPIGTVPNFPDSPPRIIKIQHHVAHIASCMLENQLEEPALGIAWDGTGYGLDGTIWGGEFFQVTEGRFMRVAHLRTFLLPGGEKAVQEPRRAAIGLLYEAFGEEAFQQAELPPVQAFSRDELNVVKNMLQKGIHSPRASSMGRLFDAVASLIGLRQKNRFDGQAAMALEFAADGMKTGESYDFTIEETDGDKPLRLNWQLMVEAVLEDRKANIPAGKISTKFHNTLAEMILRMARRTGEKQIVLSGGCFQNKVLTEVAVRRLRNEGFLPYWHRHVPPNDGGIALGQVKAATGLFQKRR